MWHDQGEWVTCWQFSILFFQYKSLVHLKCYILIQTPSQLNIWLQRYEQFFKVKNNVKHKNLSPLLACNSKSIYPTSDSFPLIMSQIEGCHSVMWTALTSISCSKHSAWLTMFGFRKKHIMFNEDIENLPIALWLTVAYIIWLLMPCVIMYLCCT